MDKKIIFFNLNNSPMALPRGFQFTSPLVPSLSRYGEVRTAFLGSSG